MDIIAEQGDAVDLSRFEDNNKKMWKNSKFRTILSKLSRFQNRQELTRKVP